ncbi:hypothetical protein HHI36_000598 [Cryptolaemus montrouzieri]|uniref:Ysc84 actin-binding domain-containing protein n=1 Tax=Cryptolaemus montrouzieri TaxID=559131 RepID=A0ABD2P673_9CUCU
MNKLLAILAVSSIIIPHNAAVVPEISKSGGGISLDWMGVKSRISLGRLISGNPADKGLEVRLGLFTGAKASWAADVGIRDGGIYAYVVTGAESGIGTGIALGVGGKIGAGAQLGCFAIVNSRIFGTYAHKRGSFAPILLGMTKGYLETLEKI